MDHNFIDLAHLIGSRKSSIFEDILELQMDTVADEEQMPLFGSLYTELEIIPPGIASELLTLAGECPYEKGPAVFYARAAFPDSIFTNNCEIMEEPVSGRLAAEQTIGGHETSTNARIKVYPNPARITFMVQLPEAEMTGKLQLFDVSGRKVLEQQLKSTLTEIGVASLANSVYFYCVHGENGLLDRGKIVIQQQ